MPKNVFVAWALSRAPMKAYSTPQAPSWINGGPWIKLKLHLRKVWLKPAN